MLRHIEKNCDAPVSILHIMCWSKYVLIVTVGETINCWIFQFYQGVSGKNPSISYPSPAPCYAVATNIQEDTTTRCHDIPRIVDYGKHTISNTIARFQKLWNCVMVKFKTLQRRTLKVRDLVCSSSMDIIAVLTERNLSIYRTFTWYPN